MGASLSIDTVTDASSVKPTAADRPSALVVCGPSGVGKGTLIKQLMESSSSYGFSCSHTTRQSREDEQNGTHYWFTSTEDFQAGIRQGHFLEHAKVHQHFYGTSIKAVEDVAAAGKCCVLDIDVQGARQVRASKLKAIFVFIAPPSVEELEHRLRGRNTESADQIQMRLATARDELGSVREVGLYDFIICNDNLDSAGQHLASIAQQALSGKTGSRSAMPVTLTAENPRHQGRGTDSKEASGNLQADSAADPSPPTPHDTEAQLQKFEISATQQHLESPRQQQLWASLMRWRGQVALITGASSGIGWATCEVLSAAGMKVVAVARRRDRLEALQHALVAQGVPIADFLPIVCDITKEAEVVALPRIILKRWPEAGIDVLINNAGLDRENAALCNGSTASWVEMISTNVLGLCMCTREAVQDMKRRQRYGHIVNVSSVAGHRIADAANGGAFYSATKHAVKALTEGLRQEVRAGQLPLRVASISPGAVDTESKKAASSDCKSDGRLDGASANNSMIYALQARDVAQAILYVLAAPDHVDVNDVVMRPVHRST